MNHKINEISDDVGPDFGDFLEHYGVLGMKWGVRKDRKGTKSPRLGVTSLSDTSIPSVVVDASSGTKRKNPTRRDVKKTSKALTNLRKAMTSEGPEFNKLLGTIAEVNRKYEKKGQFGKDYYQDLSKKLTDQVRTLINDEPGADAFVLAQYGTGRTKSDIDLIFGDKAIVGEFLDKLGSDYEHLKHSDLEEISKITFNATLDERGMVLSIDPGSVSEITHSDNIVGDFLEHYGVLGMKWGIRKDRYGRKRPTAEVLKEQGQGRKPKNATFYHTDKATGKKVMVDYNPRKVQITRSPQGFEVTGRSKKQVRKVAESIRTQLERGTKDQRDVTSKLAMTDDELRSAINRLQNERLYAQLTASPPRESSAVTKFMVNAGSQILSQAVTNVGAEYLKQALKVNINKSVSPEYRIKTVDVKKKD